MTSHPDFICIGAQKAATSWLYNALRWTPGVFLPALKELHYFSQVHCEDAARYAPKQRRRRIDQFREFHLGKIHKNKYQKMVLRQLEHIDTETVDDDWYRGIFDFANLDDICGEICPSYMTMNMRGIRHLMSMNPLVRIIVIVRDPIDRAWSHIRMLARSEHLDININAITAGKSPLTPYLQYTDYATAIPRWERIAIPGRLKIISYDQVANDPYAVFDEVTEYIGLKDAKPRDDLTGSVFKGNQVKLPDALRLQLLEKLAPQYEYLETIFPDLVPTWLERHHATS